MRRPRREVRVATSDVDRARSTAHQERRGRLGGGVRAELRRWPAAGGAGRRPHDLRADARGAPAGRRPCQVPAPLVEGAAGHRRSARMSAPPSPAIFSPLAAGGWPSEPSRVSLPGRRRRLRRRDAPGGVEAFLTPRTPSADPRREPSAWPKRPDLQARPPGSLPEVDFLGRRRGWRSRPVSPRLRGDRVAGPKARRLREPALLPIPADVQRSQGLGYPRRACPTRR